jgi:hypothetical protein
MVLSLGDGAVATIDFSSLAYEAGRGKGGLLFTFRVNGKEGKKKQSRGLSGSCHFHIRILYEAVT